MDFRYNVYNIYPNTHKNSYHTHTPPPALKKEAKKGKIIF